MKLSRKYVRWGILLSSTGVYIISLFLPALLFANDKPVLGGTLLALGWLGILTHDIAWFANPLYFLSILAYITAMICTDAEEKTFAILSNASALIFIILALFLGLTSFLAEMWYTSPFGGPRIIELGIGFYIWMLSFLILLIGCFLPSTLIRPRRPKNRRASKQITYNPNNLPITHRSIFKLSKIQY